MQCHEAGTSERRTERPDEERRRLIHRLNRIEGQIRGIRSMVEQNAYCADVLVQAAAARAALDAFSRGLLSDHIRCCVVRDLKAEREGAVDELLALLQKLMT